MSQLLGICLAVAMGASAIPAEETHPTPGDIKEFIADPHEQDYFNDFKVGRTDFEKIMREYLTVDEHHWRHGYSHEVEGTRTGRVALKDGRKIKWMVKPGGLAWLEFPDGKKMYLAAEDQPAVKRRTSALLELTLSMPEPVVTGQPSPAILKIKNVSTAAVDLPWPGFIDQFVTSEIKGPDGTTQTIRHRGGALGHGRYPGGDLKPGDVSTVKLSLTFPTAGISEVRCILEPSRKATPWWSFWEGRVESNTVRVDVKPKPITLAELKPILQSKLDGNWEAGQWEAGSYLKGLVDLGPNARGAANTLFLICPWRGDAEGISRAKKITETWNRPTRVAWTSDHWVVIGDGNSAPSDAEVMADTKRLTDTLANFMPKPAPPETPAPPPRKPETVAPAEQREISVELSFRKTPPIFTVGESIVLEARFVNRTDKPQVYRGGRVKRMNYSCQIKLMAEGGKAWSASADEGAALPFTTWEDITVPAHGQTLVGQWDLGKLVYIEGSRWTTLGGGWIAGRRIPFAEITRPGKYRVRWWDGVYQSGAPLRSEPADFQIIAAAEPAAARPPQSPKEHPFYKARSELNRRNNGAKLTATAAVSEMAADTIEVRWSLDYDGPRPPLTILRPSLENATSGRTRVIVYAHPAGGVPHEMILSSGLQPDKYWVPKGWFLTVEKGQTVSGVIPIRVSEIKAFFRKNAPDRFKEDTPPEVRLQLEHKPSDRGREYALDAWTGDLYSIVILVELKKW